LKEGFVYVFWVLGARFREPGSGLCFWSLVDLGRKYFVVLKVFFWGVVVTAAGNAIADAYIISKILACFRIDVPGELMWLLAGRAGVAAVFAVVFFEMIAEL